MINVCILYITAIFLVGGLSKDTVESRIFKTKEECEKYITHTDFASTHEVLILKLECKDVMVDI